MEKLIKEEKIYRNKNCYLQFLYIKNGSKNYLDIYNVVDNYTYYVGRIDTASFVNRIALEYNCSYLLIFEYEPIIGTNKRYVTKIFKFYDLDDNISIIDTIKNLVLKFNNSTLLYNPLSLGENCYSYGVVTSNIKSKMLNKTLSSSLEQYIEQLKINTYGIKAKKKEESKVIDLNTYLEEKPKILSIGSVLND